MKAKISARNDCLRFPQVTGGNFPAPAGKLCEAFIVPVRSAFLRERGKARFLLSSSKHFDQCNHLLLLKSRVNPSFKFDFVSKELECSLQALQTVIQKNSSLKKSSLPSKWSGTGYCHFSVFSLIPSEGEITSKSRIWSWIVLETQCIIDEHYWFFLKKIELYLKRKTRCFL